MRRSDVWRANNLTVPAIFALLGIIILYFLTWPAPIDPVPWQAPLNPGYTGVFALNERLQGVERLPIGDNHGPEAVVLDARGRIYASTHEGQIVRLAPDGSQPENWADTGGRPLGMAFDSQGNLIVADAFRGLLQVTPDGQVTELATRVDGIAIGYANDLDVAADGKIYFSDSSTKFSAKVSGDTYTASMLDILEHGGHGRLLVYDPATETTIPLLRNLNFPNGVAISPDQTYVLVNETGAYRILRYWLEGPKAGQAEPFREALPGFPDNLTAGQGGRYWVALIAPRNPLLDKFADKPWLRKIIQRLPAFLRPKAAPYGHVIALNGEGNVVLDLQDPNGAFPMITAVAETETYLYLGSLSAPAVGRLAKAMIGL
jgi:sugar lactone lactonase YvrE